MEITRPYYDADELEWGMYLLQTYTLEGLLPVTLDPQNVSRVLDVPCRLGHWADALAHTYSHMHVTALDNDPDHIVAIQRRANHPDNAQFEISNLTSDLKRFAQKKKSKFDLVHIDAPLAFQPPQGWSAFLGQCKQQLKRGGFINLVNIVPGPASSDAYQHVVCLARQQEMSPTTLCSLLKQVGFTGIKYTLHPIDLSGQVYQRFLDSTIQEIEQSLYDAQLTSKEDLACLLAQKQQQTNDAHFCAMGMIFSVLARKP